MKKHFFNSPKTFLNKKRNDVHSLLLIKGYSINEIRIYLKAFDYFIENPNGFDGATAVKDLIDIPNLDLDAMLHDYHYLVCNAGADIYIKFNADWLYAKGQERKGKGQWSSFGRFIGLTILGLGVIPYSLYVRGNVSDVQENEFFNDYKILIR